MTTNKLTHIDFSQNIKPWVMVYGNVNKALKLALVDEPEVEHMLKLLREKGQVSIDDNDALEVDPDFIYFYRIHHAYESSDHNFSRQLDDGNCDKKGS